MNKRMRFPTQAVEMVTQLLWPTVIGPVMGSRLSTLGFWLWYHRLQRHLDAQVRDAGRRPQSGRFLQRFR